MFSFKPLQVTVEVSRVEQEHAAYEQAKQQREQAQASD